MTIARVSGLFGTGVSVLALLSACNLIDPPTCTLIGADSGVGFHVPAELLAEPTGDYRLHACAGDSCIDWVARGGEMTGRTSPLPPRAGTGELIARLTVTHADSATGSDEVVFDASTSVELRLYEPNGPACEPHALQGSVRATVDGRLESLPRPA